MNDVMSGGLHRLWKDQFVDGVAPFPGMRHLDVAGGTGDIARRILGSLSPTSTSSTSTHVTVFDINEEMLAAGQAAHPGESWPHATLDWVCGNAESLPFPDATFDAYTVAFGIRNMTHRHQALQEAFRVLKPGGAFHCLEFSKVTTPGLKEAYDAYSLHVIPRVGKAVAGDAEAYRYLVESIRRFPSPEDFADEVRAAGFKGVRFTLMTHGVVAHHVGVKV